MNRRKMYITLMLLIVLTGLFARDVKNTIKIKESAFPLIPAMSEFRYTRTDKTPFGMDFLKTTEMHLWYTANTAYFVPDYFLELGFLCQGAVFESEKVHVDFGLGTAISSEEESIFVPLSCPLIMKIKGDYFIKDDHFLVSTINRFFIYGEGFIFKTELPVTYEIMDGQLVFDLGPGFNYGYSHALDYSAWAFTVTLGAAFRWGGES